MGKVGNPIGIVLGVLILLVLTPVVAAVLYRLVVVRRSSTSAVVRLKGSSTWTYGAIRYSDTEAAFYRLFSARFGPDVRLDRRSVVLGPRRQPTGPDLDVAEAGEMLVDFSGYDRQGRRVDAEVCLGPAEQTALLAWVEACSTDHVRRPGRRRR